MPLRAAHILPEATRWSSIHFRISGWPIGQHSVLGNQVSAFTAPMGSDIPQRFQPPEFIGDGGFDGTTESFLEGIWDWGGGGRRRNSRRPGGPELRRTGGTSAGGTPGEEHSD